MKVCQKCHEKIQPFHMHQQHDGYGRYIALCDKCAAEMFQVIELWMLGGMMTMPEKEVLYFEVSSEEAK